MHLPNRRGWFAIIFIILTLAIPFVMAYYVSTPDYQERYKGWRQRNAEAGIPSRSKVTSEQVLLLRDEKVMIDRTCLVFKGVAGKMIQIDLYLLDLDPDVPYALSFSRKKITDGVWLGNIMYRLLTVKEKVLRLKIASSYDTI
jgi:hypothetical protein